eukprot:scaffold130154_cov60-Phaeocystis_antarctica.AAC.1
MHGGRDRLKTGSQVTRGAHRSARGRGPRSGRRCPRPGSPSGRRRGRATPTAAAWAATSSTSPLASREATAGRWRATSAAATGAACWRSLGRKTTVPVSRVGCVLRLVLKVSPGEPGGRFGDC